MTPTTIPGGGWPRWRLIAILATVTLTLLALLTGLALALWPILNATPKPTVTSPTPNPGAVRGAAYRDRIAAEPMLQVPASAASTPEVSTAMAPTLVVPASDAVGPAGRGLPGSRTRPRVRWPSWRRSRCGWCRR